MKRFSGFVAGAKKNAPAQSTEAFPVLHLAGKFGDWRLNAYANTLNGWRFPMH